MNLTQQQVAIHVGKKNKTVVSSWELDKNEPSLSDIKKLADLLNTSVSYLIEGIDSGIPSGQVLVDSKKYTKMLEELNEKKTDQLEETRKQIERLKNH